MPNATPESPNASGIASATIRKPAIPTSISRRRTGSRGGTAFVSQAYPPYIHQTLPKISATRKTPTPVGSATRRLVSWVIVKTKTRSKNSSIVETRTSSSTLTRTTAQADGESVVRCAQAEKAPNPKRFRTSGRRNGGSVFGGWRRGGTSASNCSVMAATSRAASSIRFANAALGFAMPLTLRMYCRAAASISSRVAGGSSPRSSVMFRHMPAAYVRDATRHDRSRFRSADLFELGGEAAGFGEIGGSRRRDASSGVRCVLLSVDRARPGGRLEERDRRPTTEVDGLEPGVPDECRRDPLGGVVLAAEEHGDGLGVAPVADLGLETRGVRVERLDQPARR